MPSSARRAAASRASSIRSPGMNRLTVARTNRNRGRCSPSQRFLAARRSASRAGFTAGSPRPRDRLAGRSRSRRPCSCPIPGRSPTPANATGPPGRSSSGSHRSHVPGPYAAQVSAARRIANPVVAADLVHREHREHLLDRPAATALGIVGREALRPTGRTPRTTAGRPGWAATVCDERQREAIGRRRERRWGARCELGPHLDAEADEPVRGGLLFQRSRAGGRTGSEPSVFTGTATIAAAAETSPPSVAIGHAAPRLEMPWTPSPSARLRAQVAAHRVDERGGASRERPAAVGSSISLPVEVGQGVRLRDRQEPDSVVRRGAESGAQRVEAVALRGSRSSAAELRR